MYFFKNLPTFAEKPDTQSDQFFEDLLQAAEYLKMDMNMRTELDIIAEKNYVREEEREKSHQKLVAVGVSLIKEKGMSIDEVCHFTGLSPQDFQ